MVAVAFGRMSVSVRVSLPWMDGWMAIYSVELAYYLSYVVVWEQGMVGCHACPLGHFINSARGQVTLYMMAGVTRE